MPQINNIRPRFEVFFNSDFVEDSGPVGG